MPTPANIRYWKKKLILWKPEVTYGTDPVPTPAANWVEARNVSLSAFEADVEDRQLVRQNMGNTSKLITGKRVKLAFDVALAASGVLGTAPKIGAFLLGCGWAETVTPATKVEYTLISEAFGSGTFYAYIDKVLHKGRGARGTAKVVLSKGIPMLHVELTALYMAPTDSTPGAATTTGWPIEAPVNSANTLVCTLNAVNSFYTKFEFDQANQVAHDDLPGGWEAINIKDRLPTASMTVLAPDLATFNPYTLASAATNIAVQVVHGATAGSKVQVDLKALITGASYEDINGLTGYNLQLSVEDPTDNNTEAKLTFI